MEACVEPESPPEVGVGKPPRHHLTSIRHCASSARIAAAASSDYGMDLGTLGLISPTDVRPGFLPVFRSGSCAEIGPKSYMEDEHVLVDNLIEHLGGAPPASLPRAPSTEYLIAMAVLMQHVLYERTYSYSLLKMYISLATSRRQ